MSTMSNRLEGWEQLNGAELYKVCSAFFFHFTTRHGSARYNISDSICADLQGQRPALQQKRYAAPPNVDDVSSSGDTCEVKYPTISTPAARIVQSTPEPSAPSSLAQGWETIGKLDHRDHQVLPVTLRHRMYEWSFAGIRPGLESPCSGMASLPLPPELPLHMLKESALVLEHARPSCRQRVRAISYLA